MSPLSPEMSGMHHPSPSLEMTLSPAPPPFHSIIHHLLTSFSLDNLAPLSPSSTLPGIILLKEKSHHAGLLLEKNHYWIHVPSPTPPPPGRTSVSFLPPALQNPSHSVPVVLLPSTPTNTSERDVPCLSLGEHPFCPPVRKIVLKCLLLRTAYSPLRPCPSQALAVAVSSESYLFSCILGIMMPVYGSPELY